MRIGILALSLIMVSHNAWSSASENLEHKGQPSPPFSINNDAKQQLASMENTEIPDISKVVESEETDQIEQPEVNKDFNVAYLAKPKLTYPKTMQDFGNRGQAILQFFVDKKGNVEKIITLDSAHPDIEQIAVQGMLRAKFYPTSEQWIGTQPIYLRRPAFSGVDIRVDPFKIPKASEKLPEELQYDEAPIIKVAAPVVYPLNLLKNKITGKAKVYVIIDPTGKVHSAEIISASHPEFGLAAKASFQSWQFYPAKKDKQASWSLLTKEFVFNRTDRDSRLSESATHILNNLKKGKVDYVTMMDLDSVPKPRYSPLPPNVSNSIKNQVDIEFYLDKDGFVQLPTLKKYDNEEQAWLALTVLKRWQFEIPKVNGEAVVAKLTLPLQFQ